MNKSEHYNAYRNSKNKLRVFQIGFNKCGTRSLFHLFKDSGLPSVHYDGGRIANTMFRHHRNKRPLIDIRYRNTVFFSDMENVFQENPLYVSQHLYKKLDKQYPNSRFILNIRDKKNWLKSRSLHKEGDYLKENADKLGISEEEMIQVWSQEWDDHIKNVLLYFHHKPRKLLVFNIERDNINKLINFFQPNIRLDKSKYQHYGKTKLLHS